MEQNNDHIYFEESWNREPKQEIKKKTLEELHNAMMKDKEQERDEDGGYRSL